MTDYVILDTSYAATGWPGIVSLSVAPTSATVPIAVGDNDPRVPAAGITAGTYNYVTLNEYGWATAATNQNYVLSSRQINATAPLTGGGDLSADRTLSIGAASTITSGAVQLTDTYSGTSSALAVTQEGVSEGRKVKFAGVAVLPSYADNGDGSVTIGSGQYHLYSSSTAVSSVLPYTLSGGTFTLVDQAINYIYASYNGGSPAVLQTTVRSDIANTLLLTATPIYTIFRDGISLHYLDWDLAALGLPEKALLRLINIHRFEVEPGGLGLADTGSLHFSIGAGTVWHGVKNQSLTAMASNTDTAILYAYNGSTWSGSTVTTFNNTQYQGPTGLATLGNNDYTVNWIYRAVGASNIAYIVLGADYNKLADAQASQPPASLPGLISSTSLLVGRIIVQKNATSATEVDSALSAVFTSSGIANHNDLGGIQGGTAGEYYHVTAAEFSFISSATTVGQSFLDLANPSATTFPRINADNTVAALTASAFVAAIGAITDAPSDGTAYNRQNAAWIPAATSTGVPTSRLIDTTSPLTGGGDLSADRTLSIPAATASVSGYLVGTDWTIFNGKLSDAPSDSTIYGRQNGAWVQVPSSSSQINLTIAAGSTITIADGYGAVYPEYLIIDGVLVVDGVVEVS